jgi:DNA-binding response OmpR family regulator
MTVTELIDLPPTTDVAPLRVLVVDTSSRIGEMIRHILTRVEHAVDVVGSASEALAMLQRRGYDVVIAEQFLGAHQMSGVDLAHLIARQRPETAFILAIESLADILTVPDVDAVVLKPFGAIALRKAVARVGPTAHGWHRSRRSRAA